MLLLDVLCTTSYISYITFCLLSLLFSIEYGTITTNDLNATQCFHDQNQSIIASCEKQISVWLHIPHYLLTVLMDKSKLLQIY